ncbi:MAG: LysE family translocator [Acidimicrobiaceae bacterium]|nr:LysE family translocator [Acidimicrobiaceae bacterium]
MSFSGRFLEFVLVSWLLIIIPGPSVLFTISRGIALGSSGAVKTVFGNSIGLVLQAIFVSLGLGEALARSNLAFSVVRLVGASYLIYLGYKTLRSRKLVTDDKASDLALSSSKKIVREGLIVGLTNPKSFVFLAVVLPQFVVKADGHIPLQLLTLGLTFSLLAFLSDSAWGIFAGKSRNWIAKNPNLLARMTMSAGVIIAMLGVVLLFYHQSN